MSWGLGFRVWGLGFRVWGLGFRVWGLGFGVQGLGFGQAVTWTQALNLVVVPSGAQLNILWHVEYSENPELQPLLRYPNQGAAVDTLVSDV